MTLTFGPSSRVVSSQKLFGRTSKTTCAFKLLDTGNPPKGKGVIFGGLSTESHTETRDDG